MFRCARVSSLARPQLTKPEHRHFAELMRRKWPNLVERKLCLTGGLRHSGRSEGFAEDFISAIFLFCVSSESP